MAERLVLYLFKQDPEKLEEFAQDLSSFKKNLKTCQKCFNISEDKLCTICKEKNRVKFGHRQTMTEVEITNVTN